MKQMLYYRRVFLLFSLSLVTSSSFIYGMSGGDVLTRLKSQKVCFPFIEQEVTCNESFLSPPEWDNLFERLNSVIALYNLERMAEAFNLIARSVSAELCFGLGCHFRAEVAGTFDLDKAIEYFRKAYGLGHPKAGLPLAQCLLNKRNSALRPEAVCILEFTSGWCFDDPTFWNWEALTELGACYEARSEGKRAEVCYTKAVRKLACEGYSWEDIKSVCAWKNLGRLALDGIVERQILEELESQIKAK
ncbi:MAG: hypothetical protein LBR62_00835 [Puniceicoccales bacterium]|jgi:tetratricopeptide (TPR) repeat protein|nr:hypothetical protein [Puniceicoccales bacterium]